MVHVSEVSWLKPPANASEALEKGNEVEVAITNISPEDQKVSLSMRQLQPNPWDTVDQRHPVGMRVRGQVKKLVKYGAFIELPDGMHGLIHISDLSSAREISDRSEVLKVGDEVEAIVLNVDKANQRIALGIKQLAQGLR